MPEANPVAWNLASLPDACPAAELQFLHNKGVVFHSPGLFHDRIILDQSWALDAVYAVFDRGTSLSADHSQPRPPLAFPASRQRVDASVDGEASAPPPPELVPAPVETFLKPGREVFISYAWGDTSPEGK